MTRCSLKHFEGQQQQQSDTMSSQKRSTSVKFLCRDKSLSLAALVFAALFTGNWWPSTSGFELKSDPPIDSSSDFRNVRYEDLLPRIDQFSDTGVSHFSEILFDFARYQVTLTAKHKHFLLAHFREHLLSINHHIHIPFLFT